MKTVQPKNPLCLPPHGFGSPTGSDSRGFSGQAGRYPESLVTGSAPITAQISSLTAGFNILKARIEFRGYFMMKGGIKKYFVGGLCLFILGGIFTGMISPLGTTAHLHCRAPSDAAVYEGSGISCIDQCQAECEPGHWYSGLCRGVCILGCVPDYPGVYGLTEPGPFF